MSLSLSRRLATFFALLLFASSGPAGAAKGMLVITSKPGGAKIYVDGARKGTTPSQPGNDLVLELEMGNTIVEAVLEGKGRMMKAGESVFVPGGGIQPAHLELLPELAMVRISAGRFEMGCGSGRGCYDGEKPVHTVRVQAFEIGK